MNDPVPQIIKSITIFLVQIFQSFILKKKNILENNKKGGKKNKLIWHYENLGI